MKKKLITTIIFLFTALSLSSYASIVVMDYQGDTVVRPDGVERSLILNSDDNTQYDIAIRPLEFAMTRSDGKVQIPLENIYLNNNSEDVFMRYNDYSNVFHNLTMGGIAKNLTAKVRDYGMLPAGVYTLPLEIQSIESDSRVISGTTIFNLQFVVPAEQTMNFFGETPHITVGVNNAFKRNEKFATDSNPMLYINSNTDWVLTLDGKNFGEGAGNYYVRTISASGNVKERLQERVLIEPDKEIILAKGIAPSNNEYISLEYSVEGKDGGIVKCGNFQNSVRYRLSEDRER